MDGRTTDGRLDREGRALAYRSIGSGSDAVLWLSGHACSRYELDILDLVRWPGPGRVITVDRPGIGDSGRQRGRTLRDFVADAEALLDALDVERVAVVGFSAGTPWAMAVAAALPKRVGAAGLIAGIPPLDSDGWESLIAPEPFRIADADVLERALDRMVADPAMWEAQRAMGGSIWERHPQAWPTFRHAIEAAVAHGTAGIADDDIAIGGDWGFEPADIRCPTFVWIGDADPMVRVRSAELTAHAIPDAELTIWPGVNHLHWYAYMDTVVEHAMSMLTTAS